MIAFAVGVALTVAALAFVLAPLFIEPRVRRPRARAGAEASADDGAVSALREIEFDRATGKLSDHDYEVLSARYTQLAVEELRRAGADAMAADALAEEVIRRHRAAVAECATCGPRPEEGAAYCSTCGRFLAGRCGRCGAEAPEPGARFCPSCGTELAA